MADLIDRKKAMAEAFTIMIEGEPFEIVQMETLWGLPSVDAIPVVRCKDCAKRSFTKCPMALSRQSDFDFCSRAERKEAE